MIRIPKSWEPPGECMDVETQTVAGKNPRAKIEYQIRRAKTIVKDGDPLSLWFKETCEISKDEA